MTFQLHQSAIDRLLTSPEVAAAVAQVAGLIADDARQAAPKDSGAGAASIHAEPQDDGSARVGWDDEHFYMGFHELGTETQPPRPFLRPAALQQRGTI